MRQKIVLVPDACFRNRFPNCSDIIRSALALTMSTSTKSSEASWLTRVDTVVATWMDRHGRRLLRFALAVIFVWFGGLKLWLASPADDLVRRPIYWVLPDVFFP